MASRMVIGPRLSKGVCLSDARPEPVSFSDSSQNVSGPETPRASIGLVFQCGLRGAAFGPEHARGVWRSVSAVVSLLLGNLFASERVLNSVSLNSASRELSMKLSAQASRGGVPGAMRCQTTWVAWHQWRTSMPVRSWPSPLRMLLRCLPFARRLPERRALHEGPTRSNQPLDRGTHR